jgi:hypothetical protein
MEAYYTTLEEKIHDHCGFVGEPLEYKIQVRSSTSTPVLKDAFWVGNAGEHINVKTTLFETYKVKLRPDSVNYLILIPIFFFVPGLALKSYRENIKSFIK